MSDWNPDRHGFETLAIHAGQDPDPTTGAVVVPIYQTSTYVQEEVGQHKGYEYSRSGNPTRTALETCLAALEGGATGLAFASGLAAEDTLLRTVLKPGDHVLVPDDAYGGTYRLFAKVASKWGVEHTPVALGDLSAVQAALRPETKLIWCETPTNPLLGIADIAGLATVAQGAGGLSEDGGLHARRVPRRRRVPDRTPGTDDPRERCRVAAGSAGGPGPAQRRDRERRRPAR